MQPQSIQANTTVQNDSGQDHQSVSNDKSIKTTVNKTAQSLQDKVTPENFHKLLPKGNAVLTRSGSFRVEVSTEGKPNSAVVAYHSATKNFNVLTTHATKQDEIDDKNASDGVIDNLPHFNPKHQINSAIIHPKFDPMSDIGHSHTVHPSKEHMLETLERRDKDSYSAATDLLSNAQLVDDIADHVHSQPGAKKPGVDPLLAALKRKS